MNSVRALYNWNPVFNMVMNIKDDYKKLGLRWIENNFEKWVDTLNRKEYNEFVESLQFNQKGDLLLIRYGLAEMQEGMWNDKNSIFRECRSIVIDLHNEEIVVAPFRKFFNLNEVEENNMNNVIKEILNDNVIAVNFMDKLDGSMQTARFYNGKIHMFGSMALSKDDSWRLEDGINLLTSGMKSMIEDCPDLTFIFEMITRRDAHVVNYGSEFEGLYLIGIRNTLTGQELSNHDLYIISEPYDVPMANPDFVWIRGIHSETRLIGEFKNLINEATKKYKADEKEGWVIEIIKEDMSVRRVKLKCDDYVQIHRVLDRIASINVVIHSLADGTYDDMISKVPDAHKERISAIKDESMRYARLKLEVSLRYVNYIRGEFTTLKDAMIYINGLNVVIRGIVRNIYLDNNDCNMLKSRTGKYKKINEIREEMPILEELKGEIL